MSPPSGSDNNNNNNNDNDVPKPLVQGSVMLSDVMGRDRSMNLFAGFVRDIAAISTRLDSASQNSTVLAPLNSAIDSLPRKPWEDAADYDRLGASAYEGGEGRDRAERNLRRFVEAHVLPTSPWREGERVRSLLSAGGSGGGADDEGGSGDREVWWETRDGKRVIFPDEIEVSSISSRVGNGEVWIIKGVRNYAEP
ncbi:uncharacterized protein B0I36DRAFT_364562 [Microdochium trichocladiopsis]|uniref:FAS1 domain-containing protein n=1 Tax=Microdochium trichocladiopsis TaxID=1682393 RepID=A0A9P8Y4B2_9PEZI|nr:uncharacterized protein B0I36DRAFT_364562 [Microdochium trichocladiopsis]KAH7027350.1 hypothetical protein B0I36DRAFT_364562 [Microdochium trichocladiopsis]